MSDSCKQVEISIQKKQNEIIQKRKKFGSLIFLNKAIEQIYYLLRILTQKVQIVFKVVLVIFLR